MHLNEVDDLDQIHAAMRRSIQYSSASAPTFGLAYENPLSPKSVSVEQPVPRLACVHYTKSK